MLRAIIQCGIINKKLINLGDKIEKFQEECFYTH
jgi:hypothetical protein